MTRYALTLTLAAASVLLSACATIPHGAMLVDSTAELPSIQQRNADLFSKLKIGMPLSQFKDLVPDAYVVGQNGGTTAYELAQVQKYVTQADIDRQNFWVGAGSPNVRIARQILWFYFYNGQLVKWGRPQDWPDRPDLIIENRVQ